MMNYLIVLKFIKFSNGKWVGQHTWIAYDGYLLNIR